MGGWAGVDAGVRSSELVVVDALGRVQVRQRFAMDGIGHLEALKTLRACSGRRRASPLATTLIAAGFPVLAVHGITLARFRLGQAPSRTKSDQGDATALANIIRVQPDMHRPVPAESAELLALRVLTRAYEQRRRQQGIFERQMWSHLNRYYAAAPQQAHGTGHARRAGPCPDTGSSSAHSATTARHDPRRSRPQPTQPAGGHRDYRGAPRAAPSPSLRR